MDAMRLTAIIPVKDRAEVAACGRSLLAADPNLRLCLCDGGSTQPDCCQALDALRQQPRVAVLAVPQTGFNKSQLLNAGLRAVSSEWVLLSDADILWSRAAIAALRQAVQAPRTLATIAAVQETEPQTAALQRDRYTYAIRQVGLGQVVEIVADVADVAEANSAATRPGCGLLCARRADLLALGGYKEALSGWGWEDRDLLLRAQLCGYRWVTAGRVLHSSHPDAWRNRFSNDSPAATRDRNLVRSWRSLARGEVWGDLPLPEEPAAPLGPIRAVLPPAWTVLADE